MSAQLRICHITRLEKGANTGERIYMEFIDGDTTTKVDAFRRGHVPQGRKPRTREDPFIYTIILRTGEDSFIVRLHKTPSGLAHSMLMGNQFRQLVGVMKASGWEQKGKLVKSKEDHGWGNMTIENALTLRPVDHNTDTTPKFPSKLLKKLKQQSKAAHRELKQIEKATVADWQRMVVIHLASWNVNKNTLLSETLNVTGFDAEENGHVLGDYNGMIGHSYGGSANDSTEKMVFIDQFYETMWIALVPTHQPTAETAHCFVPARDALLERLQSYGFVIEKTKQSATTRKNIHEYEVVYFLVRST